MPDPSRAVQTLYVIDGCHPTHRFAEVLDGIFRESAARVCVDCLVQETSHVAEQPCDRLSADRSPDA